MVKAIIFDCFGVLLTDALTEIVNDLQQKNPAKAERITGLVQAASMGRLDPQASRTAVAAELGLSPQDYADKIRTGEVRNTQLFEYIKQLRPKYKTALLSNILSGGLQVRFPNNELDEYFDVVVASGDIGFAKPEHQAYQLVADKLGVRADECVFIDDLESYCQGARAAGMQAIQYQSFDQIKQELEQLLKSS